MKKTISLILTLVFLLSLSVTAFAAPVRASDESAAEQMKLIADSISGLKQDDAAGQWKYTVTDLDHNGRLELIAASEQGVNKSTFVKVWEISEDMKSLTECKVTVPEDESFPDILAENADTYYDPASDAWRYLFYDNIVLSPDEAYYVRCAVYYASGELRFQQLAIQHTVVQNGVPSTSYMDNNGGNISGEQYNDAGTVGTSEQIRSSTNFDWIPYADVNEARLADTYAVYKGVKQPVEKEQQAEPPATPAATPAPTNFMTITKHPTNESRVVGETAWFVSGASGYTSLSWTFIAPSGGEYDAQSFLNTFPFVTLDGSNSTTLKVNNLSLDMSGWGVYCTFYNGGQTARTNTAYMYVTSQPAAQPKSSSTPQVYYYGGYYNGGYTTGINTYGGGGVAYQQPDGSTTYIYSDGSAMRVDPDGTATAVDRQGNLSKYYADGSSDTLYADGSGYATYPDGSSTYLFTDGSAVSVNPSGGVLSVDQYGNWTVSYPEVYNNLYGWGSFWW